MQNLYRSMTRKVPKTQIQADTKILDSDRFSILTSEIQWNIHKMPDSDSCRLVIRKVSESEHFA